MASNFLSLDDFPAFTGKESLPEQIQALYNYLFMLRQQLQYILQNLSADNWNSTALKNMTADSQTELVAGLGAVTAKVQDISAAIATINIRISNLEKLKQVVAVTDEGATIGQDGKVLRLVGAVYINGVLFTGGEAGT